MEIANRVVMALNDGGSGYMATWCIAMLERPQELVRASKSTSFLLVLINFWYSETKNRAYCTIYQDRTEA